MTAWAKGLLLSSLLLPGPCLCGQEATAPAPPAPAGRPESLFSSAYVKEAFEDAHRVLVAPSRWEQADWATFSYSLVAIVGTGLLLDRPINQLAARNRTPGRDRVGDALGTLSTVGAAGVIGGLYLGGVLTDNPEAKATAMDGLTASIIAAGILGPTLKFVVGRGRPEVTRSPGYFKPLRQPDPGFPSGHTTEAFALASVVAAHADSPWVGGMAYGLASLVGLSRLQGNQHYASDVIAAAILGTAVGRTVVFIHQRNRSGKVAWQPWFGPEGRGLAVTVSF
jgi:membrane-associated phospholipid phosphatase